MADGGISLSTLFKGVMSSRAQEAQTQAKRVPTAQGQALGSSYKAAEAATALMTLNPQGALPTSDPRLGSFKVPFAGATGSVQAVTKVLPKERPTEAQMATNVIASALPDSPQRAAQAKELATQLEKKVAVKDFKLPAGLSVEAFIDSNARLLNAKPSTKAEIDQMLGFETQSSPEETKAQAKRLAQTLGMALALYVQ